MSLYLGVDVGTGSARAGLFDETGGLVGSAVRGIDTHHPRPSFAQQSSAEIWAAVAEAVQAALAAAGAAATDVRGIGFDATCSLVVAGAGGAPLSVDPDGQEDRDVILWLDHRAIADADEINAIGGEPLRYVGQRISPEMELPKLRWLRREAPEIWAGAARFWDLPDWLVWRATGSESRSLCSATCKWGYLGRRGHAGEGWDDAFLAAIGLDDLAGQGHERIGTSFIAPGQRAGALSAQAASELGLAQGTPVAASLIDAYAGALGTLGVSGGGDGRMAVIAGTSTCHIPLSPDPVFVPGVWGPYPDVLFDGQWALEGGQSVAGALLDAVIARHAAGPALLEQASAEGVHHVALIEARLQALGEMAPQLTATRHVRPDHHGNRSPLAEAWRSGGVSGLTLAADPDDLAVEYLAAVQALAYGTRHILEEMRAVGVRVDTLVVSGGLARNRLYLREHADATGCELLLPEQEEPVLLGSAMLGAVAAGAFETPMQAARAMSGNARTVRPRGGGIAAYHDRKYRVMRRMQSDDAAYRQIMEETS